MSEYSDYVVFVDESGDHGLETIDPGYPMFVLAFCVMRKDDYMQMLTPAIQAVKFKHFGHDNIILHERDIRKDEKAFSSLKTREKKEAFMNDLTQIVADTPFSLVCCAIKKDHLKSRYSEPENPYHIALGFGLERVFHYLNSVGAIAAKTHIMVEMRGKKEDDELELEFRRVCDGNNFMRKQLPFEIVFMDKKGNSAGLQLADLVARPVGVHVLRPNQANRAYDVLCGKLYKNSSGRVDGWGLKCFP
ncbi:MAG: DUF3800 domain-containing protein [Zetaproteobacteria bacterium]|nr:DUF3800 domain-containing protein [Zetaproteobacteria bacterium]